MFSEGGCGEGSCKKYETKSREEILRAWMCDQRRQESKNR